MSSREARGRSFPLLHVIAPVVFVAVLAFIAIQTWPAWEVLAFGAVAISIFLVGERRQLLSRFQRSLTDELQIAPAGEVRRAEEVGVSITVAQARRLTAVEVGLVCTESYDVEVQSSSTDADGHTTTSTSRETRDAVAHEAWVLVEAAVGVQSVRLPIPPGAPFSYEGDCLSFRWQVVARGRKERRLDARAEADLHVLP